MEFNAMRQRTIFGTLFILLVVVGVARSETVTIDKITVVDGDTIDFGRVRYRLIGYDTPESSTPRRRVGSKERALAYKATERLESLLRTGAVDLKEEPCSCSEKAIEAGTCNFGRKCAVLSVNGRNVGETLIAEGLAKPFVCGATRCPKLPDWPRIVGDKE